MAKHEPEFFPLVRQQVRILELMVQGSDIETIALTLGIKPKTVTDQLHKTKYAYGAVNLAQVAVMAWRDGLIHPELPERPKPGPRKPRRKLTPEQMAARSAKWRESIKTNQRLKDKAFTSETGRQAILKRWANRQQD